MGPAMPGMDAAALRAPGAAPGSDPARKGGGCEGQRAPRAGWLCQGRVEQPSVAPGERLRQEPIKPRSLEWESAAAPTLISRCPATPQSIIRERCSRHQRLCPQILRPLQSKGNYYSFFLWLYSRIKKTAAAFYYLSSLSSLCLPSSLHRSLNPCCTAGRQLSRVPAVPAPLTPQDPPLCSKPPFALTCTSSTSLRPSPHQNSLSGNAAADQSAQQSTETRFSPFFRASRAPGQKDGPGLEWSDGSGRANRWSVLSFLLL